MNTDVRLADITKRERLYICSIVMDAKYLEDSEKNPIVTSDKGNGGVENAKIIVFLILVI